MILGVVVGLGILAALFMYLAFTLDDMHAVVKYLAVIFSILVMLALSSYILNNQDPCELKLINQTISQGGNFTAFEYDYICVPDPQQSAGLTAYKLMNRFTTLLGWYAFVFVVYWIFQFFGIDLLQKVKDLFGRP